MELQVRDARLTDIDRITGLMERSDSRWSLDQLNDAADVMRQARNRGCVALEGNVPEEPAELARWESVGFTESGPRMRLPLVRSAVAIW